MQIVVDDGTQLPVPPVPVPPEPPDPPPPPLVVVTAAVPDVEEKIPL
jgi:hypothetical protein